MPQGRGLGVDHDRGGDDQGSQNHGKGQAVAGAVQGLGRGLEVEDPAAIVSPTFTLANEYRGLVDIFHLDLYRLESPREFAEAGLDDYLARPGLTLVEWPEKMPPGFWPAGCLTLSLAFKGAGRFLRVISRAPWC